MKPNSHVIVRKSVFCAIVISNGVLIAALCFLFVEPVYRERVEQLETPDAHLELLYLRALFGVGALVSTITALTSLLFMKPIQED